jgi:signal transduction histidine kinase
MSMDSNQDLQATQQIIRLFELGKNEAEQTIDRLPGIYLVINREGVVLRSNDYYSYLSGLDSEEALFTNLSEIFAPEVWSLFLVNLRELEDIIQETKDYQNNSVTFEMAIKNANNESSVFLWQLKYFAGAATGEALFYVFGNDVTELRVKEKQLVEIFESIPVGIVTCNSKGLIENHYSKYCEHLFGGASIAGEHVFQRIFKPCLKGMKDSESKGAYALTDCLDQSMDIYELLSMAFPKQIFYPDLGSETEGKYIGVSYQPIVLSGKVDRILLMFSDRTALHLAQLEQDKKNKVEEAHVRRILEAKACIPDVIPITSVEMETLIPNIEELFASGNWKGSLSDLHSLKGNARLSGLKTIAEMAHDLEAMAIKMSQEPDNSERKEKLLGAFQTLKSEWKEFRELFRMMGTELGIQLKERHPSSMDIGVVQELFNRYNDLLYSTDKVGATLLRERIQLALEGACYESIDFVKPLAKARASEVASAYGKEVDLEFNGTMFKIPTEAKSIVNECIVHLLSNAVAHGIEDPEERNRLGKSSKGKVRINFWDEMGLTNIEVIDDGKGIDVEKVRQAATKKGVLTLEESLSRTPEDIINLIFEPGFSTAEKVDEIAGRGVGLAAIKEKLLANSGSVRVYSEGSGKGTRFVINFDTVKKKLVKRLVSQLDFVQILKENLETMTSRNHVKANLSIAPELSKKDAFLYCDVGKVSLALLTLIGSTSSGNDVKISITNQKDRMCIRVDRNHVIKEVNADFFKQYPEYELSKRSCERFILHHQGDIVETAKGLEVTFGHVVDAKRIPSLTCYIQGAQPDQGSLELFKKVENWAASLNLKIERTNSITDASLVIGDGANDLGAAAVDKDAAWTQVRQKLIEAIESSLGIGQE